MRKLLVITVMTLTLVSCSKEPKVASENSFLSLSEAEKIRTVGALYDGKQINMKRKVDKDTCLLKYFEVDGEKVNNVIKAKVKYDQTIAYLLFLNGGKTSDPKWCDAFEKVIAKLKSNQLKAMTVELEYNTVTGKVLKKPKEIK